MHTTNKAEQQEEEKLIEILKTRTKKTCSLSRQHGPVNWFGSHIVSRGFPVMFRWNVNNLKPKTRITLSNSIPLEIQYKIRDVQGLPLAAEWECAKMVWRRRWMEPCHGLAYYGIIMI